MSNNYRNLGVGLVAFFKGRRFNRGATWGLTILVALMAFEIFNFSTTQFALTDVLGTELAFAGIRWATILAIAFCGIDFAGIARIFTPEQGRDEPAEVYYLFGAWLLAAGFNACLTWWGVSVAIGNNANPSSSMVVSDSTMTKSVPIIVAGMVWLIRVLIIGTFSLAGDRLFTTGEQRVTLPFQSSPSGQRLVNPPMARSASGQYSPSRINTATRNSNHVNSQRPRGSSSEASNHPTSYSFNSSGIGDRRYDS